MTSYVSYVHRSVMVAEVLEHLAPRDGAVYCDVTIGGGGHTEALLRAVGPRGRVYGIDRDQGALSAARTRLWDFGGCFVPLHGAFSDLRAILDAQGVTTVDGILADLGVSSPQLDTAERGFSFQRKGPIDMRMDASQGETALDLIRRLDEGALCDIIHSYGEERHARSIARAIKEAETQGRLTSTLALAEVVTRAQPPSFGSGISPATRTFQALRMAVNDELRQLDRFLAAAPGCLAPGGRLVILSFHSLEDRLVKRRLREHPALRVLGRGLGASEDEQRDNPRSRSVHLRAAEVRS